MIGIRSEYYIVLGSGCPRILVSPVLTPHLTLGPGFGESLPSFTSALRSYTVLKNVASFFFLFYVFYFIV